MTKRTYVKKGRTTVTKRTGTEVHEDTRTQRQRSRGDKERKAVEAEIDELLAEVDELLEENTTKMGITAEQFVSRFIQMGGQ